MPFVDTNIFLRYLTRDDPDKAQACFELFKRAEANQITLTATETVIAEVVYVLSSKCINRAMPTTDSDGCRPPVPGHADHLFRHRASSSWGAPESVVALNWNQWTACSRILDSKSDPPGSGAG